MINRLIEVIEDRHTLSDCLFFIMQALETKKMPDILPTLNDSTDEANLQFIIEKICGEEDKNIVPRAK